MFSNDIAQTRAAPFQSTELLALIAARAKGEHGHQHSTVIAFPVHVCKLTQ